MSFLHPLYWLAAAAIAVPVLLHLARRRNRAAIPWSSLRFLVPAPPRLERRKRVEHWALLLLRCLALVLLAATFARPLWRRPLPGMTAAPGTRVVLLIDVSASMRRQGAWAEARARVAKALKVLGNDDRLAILAFSDRAQTVLSFDEWAQASPGTRAALAETRLQALSPGWGATDLGAALIAAAEAVGDDARGTPVGAQRVVLVSDLTQGARIATLSSSEWPADLRLTVERIDVGGRSNLSLQAVPDGNQDAPVAARLRVRVVASAGSSQPLNASLRWSDGAGGDTRVSVPPGESRVIDAPARPATAAALLVDGDDEDFDNRFFVVPSVPVPARVIYLGAEDDKDATGSRYFLERALVRTRVRAPVVDVYRAGDPAVATALKAADVDLVLVTEAPGAAVPALRGYLAAGGTVLFAPRDAEAGAGLFALTGTAASSVREAPAGKEAVLTAVDLRHPLLAAFADGRAGDFSHVRFWRHRVFDAAVVAGADVLAKFDDGSPAWWVLPVGQGRLVAMASGWATSDSQLGLSSKLVPFLWTLLDGGGDSIGTPRFVGDPISLPAGLKTVDTAVSALIQRPDGRREPLAAGTRRYTATDVPGIYEMSHGDQRVSIAVNVAPAESVTAPMPIEQLARAGIAGLDEAGSLLAPVAAAAHEDASLRAAAVAKTREASFLRALEGQQRTWRWALLGVLLALGIEGLLTLRRSRAVAASTPEAVR